MNALPHALVAVLAATASLTVGADEANGRRASRPEWPAWEFGLTAYPTFVRNGENYTSAIAVADRGPLHLEARYDYESIGARSAFVGWRFSGGEGFSWELTPLLGGVWGTTRGFVPGLEASLGWGSLDFYLKSSTCAAAKRCRRATSTRGANWAGVPSSGFGSESRASAPMPTKAGATSSADRSHR